VSIRLQIADAAEEFADARALGEDLGVGELERLLGVESPLPPGRFMRVVGLGEQSDTLVTALPGCSGDSGFRIRGLLAKLHHVGRGEAHANGV